MIRNGLVSQIITVERLDTKRHLRSTEAEFKKLKYLKCSRCIKPNDKKAAHIFNESLVCHQIRYLGLLENVRVRRAGYAFRQAYEPCLERYKMLCKQTWPHWKGPAR